MTAPTEVDLHGNRPHDPEVARHLLTLIGIDRSQVVCFTGADQGTGS